MKKLLCLMLASVLSLFIFVGCNNGGDDVNYQEFSLNVDKNISTTLTIGIPGGNANEETMIQCLIDDFKLQYPNVKFKYKYISIDNYGNGITRLATSGTLPDIIWSNSPDIYEAYGYMEDLTSYISKTDELNGFGGTFKDTFYTEYFDMGKIGGKMYVVPRSCDCVVAFYRKDWFQAAGVDMTKVVNGWTWEDMLDTCSTLRTWMDNNGLNGSYCLEPNLTSWLSVNVPMIASLGGEVISSNGSNVIDSAANLKVLELARELVDKRYVADSQTTVAAGFEQGSAGIYFQSMSVSLLQNKTVLKDKIDLVTFPLIGQGDGETKDYSNAKIGAGIAGYCISKTSQNKNLAWQFLLSLLSKDGQQNMANNGLNLASIRKDLSNPTVANCSIFAISSSV